MRSYMLSFLNKVAFEIIKSNFAGYLKSLKIIKMIFTIFILKKMSLFISNLEYNKLI